MSNFRFWFVLQCCCYAFVVLEGPNGNIFCIVYWFYKCFATIDVRVCGGLPVFEFCLFHCVFADFGERHSSLILYWFCKCFVKIHLTVVGGCRMLVVGSFYNVFLIISGSWKGQPEAYFKFYICFIYVSCKLM